MTPRLSPPPTILRYTLVGDGPSDRALMPVLHYALSNIAAHQTWQGSWANPPPAGSRTPDLAERLQLALNLYPCDLLFVHRDAEAQHPSLRHAEIHNAVATLPNPPPAVCVVPVRMTEAWLLIDEAAIRRAADNPNGSVPLSLPAAQGLEKLPDPKEHLTQLLEVASQKNGRRLQQFRRDMGRRRVRVADLIQDFAPLASLPSFHQLQHDIRQVLQEVRWL